MRALSMSEAIMQFSDLVKGDSVSNKVNVYKPMEECLKRVKSNPIDVNFELSAKGKTRKSKKFLKTIVSPKIEGRVEIKKGLWVVPRVKFKTIQERDEWISDKKSQYGIV